VIRRNNYVAELIVVDDGSRDGTREKVAELSHQFPVTLVCRDGRNGLASAVVEGAQRAQYDLVIVMDGDLSHSPDYIPLFVRAMLCGCFDIAIGSRYIPGGSTPDWPLKRKMFSRLASLPAQTLTGINDPLSGYFAVSREKLLNINPDIPGFKICLELLLGQNKGLEVIEIPICFHDRQVGTSKMSRSVILLFLYQLVRLCSISMPPRHWTTFVLLICAGLLSDAIVYSTGIALKFSLFCSHAAAVIISIIVVLFLSHVFYPRRTIRPGLFRRPVSWFLVAMLLTFRTGVYVFAQHMAWGYPLLPPLLATTFSAFIVTFVIFQWNFDHAV